MKTVKPKFANHDQRGFTLIEFLVGLTIVGLIGTVVVQSLFVTYDLHNVGSNRIPALAKVQNVGYWMGRDGQMAQTLTTDDDPSTAEIEVLTLTWAGWPRTDGGNLYSDAYVVRYTYDNNELLRHQHRTTDIYDNKGVWQTTTENQGSTFIADYLTRLSVSITSGTETSMNEMLVEATARVESESITRTYRVLSRPGS